MIVSTVRRGLHGSLDDGTLDGTMKSHSQIDLIYNFHLYDEVATLRRRLRAALSLSSRINLLFSSLVELSTMELNGTIEPQ